MEAGPNPYQPPLTAEVVLSRDGSPAEPWKSIARRWERLRVLYNALLFLAGLPALVLSVMNDGAIILVAVAFYAFAANVLYLLGPIAEMYLNWLVDAAPDYSPNLIEELVRSRWITVMAFVVGLLFSLALTSFVSLATVLAS